MLCQCGKREATIHEVVIRNGKKIERHLCEDCARECGIDVQPQAPISELISKYMMAQGAGVQAIQFRKSGLTCPTCRLTYNEFKQHGLLGCATCYVTFESQLSPLLERVHEGATHHVGKVPKRALAESRDRHAEGAIDPEIMREGRLASLRKQLDDAIRREEYEQAAEVRDAIQRLEDDE